MQLTAAISGGEQRKLVVKVSQMSKKSASTFIPSEQEVQTALLNRPKRGKKDTKPAETPKDTETQTGKNKKPRPLSADCEALWAHPKWQEALKLYSNAKLADTRAALAARQTVPSKIAAGLMFLAIKKDYTHGNWQSAIQEAGLDYRFVFRSMVFAKAFKKPESGMGFLTNEAEKLAAAYLRYSKNRDADSKAIVAMIEKTIAMWSDPKALKDDGKDGRPGLKSVIKFLSEKLRFKASPAKVYGQLVQGLTKDLNVVGWTLEGGWSVVKATGAITDTFAAVQGDDPNFRPEPASHNKKMKRSSDADFGADIDASYEEEGVEFAAPKPDADKPVAPRDAAFIRLEGIVRTLKTDEVEFKKIQKSKSNAVVETLKTASVLGLVERFRKRGVEAELAVKAVVVYLEQLFETKFQEEADAKKASEGSLTEAQMEAAANLLTTPK